MRGNGRFISAALASTAACSALTLAAAWSATGPAQAATAAGASRSASADTGGGSEPVIIFLKNQPAGPSGTRIASSQRSAVMQAAQAPYVGQLQQLGATKVHGYRLADAIAAQVPRSAVDAVADSPGVASVIPDSPIIGPGADQAPAATMAIAAAAKTTKIKTPPGACSSSPQLEPEGLGPTNTVSKTKGATTARSLGYTGSGVKVGFLADGIDTANPNLTIDGKSKIKDYKDFSGDGTGAATAGGEAFMDANAIAGQGSQVYNVAGFSAQVPDSACKIQIDGVAPGSSLVALKVFGKNNVSTTSAFLQAIDHAVYDDHVNVLDESFGSNPFPDVTSLDAVKQFNDMAVAAGTTVVVAGGDAGPFNTIGSPASDPAVISVGASTDFRFYAQTNYAGADQFAPKGWESGNVSALSSGGYTQDGRTLDLVAPGDLSFASCTPSARYSSCVNFLGKPSSVEESGGTSQAAPMVAGAAALVIQAYAKAHGGAKPTPAVVKRLLTSSATDLGAPATEQGAGLLNSLRAVELAADTPAHPGGPALELSQSQLNDTGQPGATAAWSGHGDQHVQGQAEGGRARARLRRQLHREEGVGDAVGRKEPALHQLGRGRIQLRHGEVHRAVRGSDAQRLDRLADDRVAVGQPERTGPGHPGQPVGQAGRALDAAGRGRLRQRAGAAAQGGHLDRGNLQQHRHGRRDGREGAVRRDRSQDGHVRHRLAVDADPRAGQVRRGAPVGQGAVGRGRLQRLAGAFRRLCWPGRWRGERAGHAARAGTDRAQREREVQRGADRRQRPGAR